LDEYYGSLRQQIQTRLDELQDELATMRREVASAQAIAEEEERLRQERVTGQEAADREQKGQEAARAAEVRRLRQEQERLEAVRRKEEEATRQSLRGLDLRRSGNPGCGFGPFEKFDCNDMGAHNDLCFFIDTNGRRQMRRRNECPQCKWTNVDWHAWPKFEA
jgi:vacuolar-type H+-ATPase subunit I/STV1